jgi:hypothetical protein
VIAAASRRCAGASHDATAPQRVIASHRHHLTERERPEYLHPDHMTVVHHDVFASTVFRGSHAIRSEGAPDLRPPPKLAIKDPIVPNYIALAGHSAGGYEGVHDALGTAGKYADTIE